MIDKELVQMRKYEIIQRLRFLLLILDYNIPITHFCISSTTELCKFKIKHQKNYKNDDQKSTKTVVSTDMVRFS